MGVRRSMAVLKKSMRDSELCERVGTGEGGIKEGLSLSGCRTSSEGDSVATMMAGGA